MFKHLTKITDLSKDEILQIFKDAKDLDYQYSNTGQNTSYFKNKSIAMVFEKPSLRTRVSFEVAATHLGGSAIYLTSSDILASGSNIKGRESIPDIAKNLENFTDIILARAFSHETIISLAENSHIPVINALCDLHHPTQTLADLYTIFDIFGGFPPDLKIAFVGDGCNTANSLMLGCDILNINFAIATPKGYEIPEKIFKLAKNNSCTVAHNPKDAVKNADIIYTDTWVSMGLENEFQQRLEIFKPYQVNKKLLSYAKPDVKIMHCMPAHRGEEITSEVIDSSASVVFKQSSAKLLIAKAILKFFTN
ncbi:ornithine carbamoyltransferase [Candidatus Peregrinibacteria bacterium]|nr:ornithine carbamoyltransferase [Candidatus Peregrinibacteria bacterium]